MLKKRNKRNADKLPKHKLSTRGSDWNPSRHNATGSMWKFYADDSPGIKVGPVPVLIIALFFIGVVLGLHIWAKCCNNINII